MKTRIAVVIILLSMLLSINVFGDDSMIVEDPEGYGGISSFEKEDIINNLSEYYVGKDRTFLECQFTALRIACEDNSFLPSSWIEYPPLLSDTNNEYLNVHFYADNHLWIQFKPGLFGYYDDIDVDKLFPELEIESVLYGNMYERQEYQGHDWFPSNYNEETYCLDCVLLLKTHDADSLVRGLEYLRTLEFLNYARLDGGNLVEYANVMVGDVNGDGTLNARDVIGVMKYIVSENEKINLRYADVNSDGKTNAKDVVMLLKLLVSEDKLI